MIELSEEIAVPTAPAMELIVALPLIYFIRTSTLQSSGAHLGGLSQQWLPTMLF